VSAYIEKCARSLFEQTLDSLEILFIDDCSPDDSVKIIESILNEYPERKEFTRIIHMSANAGQAGVRRHGIIEATGQYIIHCDGDDWVDKTLYEQMYNVAVSQNADITICDFVEEFGKRSIHHSFPKTDLSPKNFLKTWYCNTTHMSCCNKLIKRSVYYDNSVLPWIGLNMWEDNGLTTRLFYYASRFAFVKGLAYHYNRINIGSMTAGYGEKQVNQMIAVAEHLAEFFHSKPDAEEFEKTVNAFKYLAKLNLITDSFANYRRYKSLFPECDSIVSELDRNAFSTKGRIRFHMVRLGFAPIFILLFKLKNLLKK